MPATSKNGADVDESNEKTLHPMCKVRKILPDFCRQLCTSHNSTTNLGQTTSNIIERHFSLSEESISFSTLVVCPPSFGQEKFTLVVSFIPSSSTAIDSRDSSKNIFYYSVNGISLQLSKKGEQTKERINELLSQQKLFNVTTAFKTLRD